MAWEVAFAFVEAEKDFIAAMRTGRLSRFSFVETCGFLIGKTARANKDLYPHTNAELLAVLREHARAYGHTQAVEALASNTWRTNPTHEQLEALVTELERFTDTKGVLVDWLWIVDSDGTLREAFCTGWQNIPLSVLENQ